MNLLQRSSLCGLIILLWSSQPPAAAQEGPLQVTRIAQEPSGLALEWASADPGVAFTVQSRDRLTGGLWVQALSPEPWPLATNRWIDLTAGTGDRFYRVLAVTPAQRGRLVSVTRIQSYTVQQVAFLFALAKVPLTPDYGVDVYKVLYETVDPWGGKTQASGVLAVPQNPGHAFPLASYQHGTLVQPQEAPSAQVAEQIPGIGLAAGGYLATVPDFLGMGDSPGYHPYHHARSEATAAIDLLRAVRTWCGTNNIALNGQLFVLGYSQGGHATLALHRELEAFHTNEFSITASAPMAGAYDLAGVTAEDFLSGRPVPNPYYFAYLLYAYQDVYRLTEDLADWLASPYDTTLPPLMARRASSDELNAALPSDVTRVLRPEVLAALRTDPGHPLRVALRDNTLLDWRPRAPLRLYHCRGDADVPYANTEAARDAFRAAGASQVEAIDPNPAADHGGCVVPSFVDVKAWFDQLKQ